ncbi:hypothetical protein [Fischerella sp. PCC 9605]|uniref:hypothetical protein n=1 Tax=Fischerella sp. PCC 9605 TaxID=1173024 RepID=UPI003FA46A5C
MQLPQNKLHANIIEELMHKTVYLKKFLLLITLLNLTSCLSSNVDRANNQPSREDGREMSQTKGEEDVFLDWFTASTLKGTDTVSSSEAKLFINNVYQTLDNKIFDPTFKKELRQ